MKGKQLRVFLFVYESWRVFTTVYEHYTEGEAWLCLNAVNFRWCIISGS